MNKDIIIGAIMVMVICLTGYIIGYTGRPECPTCEICIECEECPTCLICEECETCEECDPRAPCTIPFLKSTHESGVRLGKALCEQNKEECMPCPFVDINKEYDTYWGEDGKLYIKK